MDSIYENTSALISKALDGRITKWEGDAERIFGFSAAEAIGKHISIIIPFDFQDEEYELLDRLKAEDYLEVRNTVRRTKAGTFIQVRLSAMPIRDTSGKIVGALKKVIPVRELSGPVLLPEHTRDNIDITIIN